MLPRLRPVRRAHLVLALALATACAVKALALRALFVQPPAVEGEAGPNAPSE